MFLSEFYQKDLKVQVLNIALSQPNQLNDTILMRLLVPQMLIERVTVFILSILFLIFFFVGPSGPVWSQWTQWLGCSVTCGTGGQSRFRTCTGVGCDQRGSTFRRENQQRSCNSGPCRSPTVGPVWSQWTQWLGCSVTCGTGGQSRSRTCTGVGCDQRGSTFRRENQQRSCNSGPCTSSTGRPQQK